MSQAPRPSTDVRGTYGDRSAQREPGVQDELGARTVRFVVPGSIDDPAEPSGGNVYDRRVCRALAAAGRPVQETPLAGTWPRPGAGSRAELARTLAASPDGAVVVLDGIVACGVPDVLVPESRRLRTAVIVHLPLADETGLAPERAAELTEREGEVLRAAGAVVTTSRWAARRVTARHRLAASRVHVVEPGADSAPPGRGGGELPQLLCPAAVIPRKGQDLLVEALASVADLPWRCDCVGSVRRAPEYVAGLRRRIGELGLTDRVRLVGPRTGGELASAYDCTDLLVLASRAETYGMVVTEALSRGVPVLVTEVDGVPAAVGRAPDGSLPGVLVPADDARSLGKALRRFLSEPGLRRQLAASALGRRGELATWPAAAARLADVLDQLRSVPRRFA